jgi:nucleoside-diphosphate-sugar epimerase
MNCLLTGSSGFLGKSISVEISKEIDLYTLSRTEGDFITNLDTEIVNFGRNFDIVIHAAGKAHEIPNTEKEINEFNSVNVIGTINLLKGLEVSGMPQMFVFISSVSVYGLDCGNEIDELSSLNACDPYGKSKIEAENLIKNWCKKNRIKLTILRLPLVIGSNPPGNLGSMIYAIRKNYYFNVANGSAKKSMVLATDIAKYILKAAKVGGIYNLTDGYNPNFNELSKCIASQVNKKFIPNLPYYIAKFFAFIGDSMGPKFLFNSKRLNKITSTLTFDDSKARKAFGWHPTPVLGSLKINE